MLQNDFLQILNSDDKQLIYSHLHDINLSPQQRIQLLQKYRQLNDKEKQYEPVTYTINQDMGDKLLVSSLDNNSITYNNITAHSESTAVAMARQYMTKEHPDYIYSSHDIKSISTRTYTVTIYYYIIDINTILSIFESETKLTVPNKQTYSIQNNNIIITINGKTYTIKVKNGQYDGYFPKIEDTTQPSGSATTVTKPSDNPPPTTNDQDPPPTTITNENNPPPTTYTTQSQTPVSTLEPTNSDTSTVITSAKANSRKGPWIDGVNAHYVTIIGKDYLIPDGLDGAIDNPDHRQLAEFIELDHKGRELVTKAYKAKQKENSLESRQDQEEAVEESAEPPKEDGPKIDVQRDEVDEWINVRTEKYKEVHKLDASQENPANKHYINFKQDYVVLIRKKPFFAATAQQRYVDATETMVTPITQSDTGTETVTTPVTFDNYYWKYDLEPAWEYHHDSDTSMGSSAITDKADVDSGTSSQTLTFDNYYWNHKLNPEYPALQEEYKYTPPKMEELDDDYQLYTCFASVTKIRDFKTGNSLGTDIKITVSTESTRSDSTTFIYTTEKERNKDIKEYTKLKDNADDFWMDRIRKFVKAEIKTYNLTMVQSDSSGTYIKWDWEQDLKNRKISGINDIINGSIKYTDKILHYIKNLQINTRLEFRGGRIYKEDKTAAPQETNSETTYTIETTVINKTANYDLMQSSNVNTARHDIEQYLNPLIKIANDNVNNTDTTIATFYSQAKTSLDQAKQVLFDNLKEGMIVSAVYNEGKVYIKPGIANDANIKYKIISKVRDPSPLKTVYDYSSDTSTLSTDLSTFNSEVSKVLSLTDRGVISVNETVQDYFKKARASIDSLNSTFGGQFADKVKFTIEYDKGKGSITGKKPSGTNTAQSPYMYSKDYKKISETNDGTNVTTVATFKDVLRDAQGRPILPEDNYLRAYQVNNFINISVNTSVHNPGTCSVTIKGAERVICAENNKQSSNGWFSWSDLVGGWLNINEEGKVNDGTGSEYTTTSALDRETVQRQEKGKEGAKTRSSTRFDVYNPGTNLSKTKNVSWKKAQSNWSQVQNGPFSADTTFRSLFKAREAKYGWRFAEKCDWEPMDEILIFGKSLTLRADDKELDSLERDENGILEGYHHNTSAMFKMEQIFFGYIEQVNKTYDASRGCVISVTAKDHMKLLEQTRTCTNIGNLTPGMVNGIPALDWSDNKYGLVRIVDPIMLRVQMADGAQVPAGTVPDTSQGSYESIMAKSQQFPYFFGNCFAGWYPDEIIQTLSVQSGVPEKFVTKRVEPMHQFCPFLVDQNEKPLDVFSGNSETAYSICQKAAQKLMLEFFADEEGNIVLKIPNWALGANMLQMNCCNIKYPDDIKNAKLPEFSTTMTKDGVPILHVKGDSGGAGGSATAAGGGLAAGVSNFANMINDAMSKLLKSTDGKKLNLETLPSNINPNNIGPTWANPNVCTNKSPQSSGGAAVKSAALIDLADAMNVFASVTEHVVEDILDKQLTNVIQIDNHTIRVRTGRWYESHIGSLYNLAKRYYGSGRKWKIIADANDIKDPTELVPGQEIKIVFDEPISDYLVGGSEIIDADDIIDIDEFVVYSNELKNDSIIIPIEVSQTSRRFDPTQLKDKAQEKALKDERIPVNAKNKYVSSIINDGSVNIVQEKDQDSYTYTQKYNITISYQIEEEDKSQGSNKSDPIVPKGKDPLEEGGGEGTVQENSGGGNEKESTTEDEETKTKGTRTSNGNNSGVTYDLPQGWTPDMLKPGFKETPEYKALSHKDRVKVCKAYNKKMKEEGKTKQDKKLEEKNAQKDANIKDANKTIEQMKDQMNARMQAACKFLSGRTDMDIPVLKSEYIISFTLMDSDQDVYNYISVQGTNIYKIGEGTPQQSRCIPLWDNICQFGLRAHPAMEANVLCGDPLICELMGAMLLFKSQANRYKAVVTAIDDSAIRVGNPIRMYMYDEHPFRNATYIYFSEKEDEIKQNENDLPNVNFDGSGTTTETLNLSFDNYCLYSVLDPQYSLNPSADGSTSGTTDSGTGKAVADMTDKEKEEALAELRKEIISATETLLAATNAYNAALANVDGLDTNNLDNSKSISDKEGELADLEQQYNDAVNANKAAKADDSSAQLKACEKKIKQCDTIIEQQKSLIEEPSGTWEQICNKYGLDKKKIQRMGTTESGWQQAALTEAKKKQQNAIKTKAKAEQTKEEEKTRETDLKNKVEQAKTNKKNSQDRIDNLKKQINDKKKEIKELQKSEEKTNKKAEKAEKDNPNLKAKRLEKERAESVLAELKRQEAQLTGSSTQQEVTTINDKDLKFKIVKTSKAWDKLEQGEFPDSSSDICVTKSAGGSAREAWNIASDITEHAAAILKGTQNKTVKKYYEKAQKSAESIKTAWESAYKPGAKFTIDYKKEKITGTRTLHEGSGVDEAQQTKENVNKPKEREEQEAVIFDERIFKEQAVFYIESMSRNIDVQNVSTMTLQLRAGRMMGQASCFDIMAYFYNLYYKPWQSRQFYYDRGGNNTGLVDPHFQDGTYEQALHDQYNKNRTILSEKEAARQAKENQLKMNEGFTEQYGGKSPKKQLEEQIAKLNKQINDKKVAIEQYTKNIKEAEQANNQRLIIAYSETKSKYENELTELNKQLEDMKKRLDELKES